MNSLTVKQIETLEALNDLEIKLGRFPSLRELCVHLNLNSRLAAYDRLKVLVKKGLLFHSPNSKNKNVFSLSREGRVLASGSVKVISSTQMPGLHISFRNEIQKPLVLKTDTTSGGQDSEMKVGYNNGQYGLWLKNFDSTTIIGIVSITSYLTFAGFCFKNSGGSWIPPTIFVTVVSPLFYSFYKLINRKEY